MTLRLAAGLVAAFVVMLVLGGLWNGFVAAEFYAQRAVAITREADDVRFAYLVAGYVLLTCVLGGLLLVAPTLRSHWTNAVATGACVGLAAFLPVYLLIYAGWKVSLTMLLVDAGWHAVETAIGAIVLAAIAFPSIWKA